MAKLKGHAVIELTDVKTGKKERVEHDNIITNAVKNMFDKQMPLIGMNNINTYFLTLVKKAMGGLFIFSNTLTENINNVVLPDAATAELTGYAGNVTSDGSDNKRGDFNEEESGAISNGYKFVWDFGTNDANGDIAAIALTNDVAGYHGYHYSPLQAIRSSNANQTNLPASYKGLGFEYINPAGMSASIALYAVELDSDNGTVKYIRKNSTTEIEIRTYKIDFNTVSLENKIGAFTLIHTDILTIADSVQTATDRVTFVDGGDGFYYGLYGYSSGSNYILTISKINKTTLEYTSATSYTLANASNFAAMQSVNQLQDGFKVSPVIRNGYIYSFRGTYNYNGSTVVELVKISLSNPAEFTTLANSSYAVPNAQFGSDLCIYKQNDMIISNGYAIDANDRLLPTQIQLYYQILNYYYICAGKIVTDGKQILISAAGQSSAMRFDYLPVLQYLATINNLDAPVTKTAAKTMKITYTLTLAE